MNIIKHDSDRPDLVGQPVTLIRVVREPEEGFDADALPMAYVLTAAGETVLVWQDEVDEPFPETLQ